MNKKQIYEDKLKAQLNEWDAKIDVLKAKAEKSETAVKADYYETIEDLKKKQNSAKEKLGELQTAQDDAWEDLKDGLDSAWSALGSAVNSAASRFK